MGIEYHFLPPAMRTLADTIGMEATLALIHKRAPCRIAIPQKWQKSSLVKLIGTQAAEKLCDTYGGDIIDMPACVKTRMASYVLAQPKASTQTLCYRFLRDRRYVQLFREEFKKHCHG